MNDARTESQGNVTLATRLDALLDRALLLDLETDRQGVVIHKIGALRQGRAFERQGHLKIERALAELDAFAGDAAFVVGHNLLGHDLPLLRVLAPALNILGRPIVDTLFTSPLAFPANPYHHLVKDYKPVRDSISDPVADCRLAERILGEQFAQFGARASQDADLLGVYRFCFQGATLLEGNATGGDGIAEIFRLLSAPLPSAREVHSALIGRWAGIACISVAPRLILDHLADPRLRPVLAYAAAWLTVAGANSVLPPWVRNRFPATVPLLKALRDRSCDDPECIWCRTVHDPDKQLAHWFGFDAFRSEPVAADGGSLQREIVRDGFAEQSMLAILPTGGGKSLCFQLPALVRNLRRGTLTVVVSPLQALMKDQVDNLVAKTGTTSTAAIYGLLTPPERGDVMERVRLGDIAILYISPEQLRNRSVSELLAAREIGCWVFDEAHCLSKWGHDFRPDYLYAGRFIRELAARQRVDPPPVACFTATAKLDVIAEVVDFFDKELGRTLTLHEGGVERDNLRFEVQTVGRHEKDARLHEILTEHLADGGGAVVYASRRRRTEELAEGLAREGWAVEAFHAGLPAPEKKRVQEAFVNGELRVICATNAFGMGVDKEDVRVVIHADIPGSLENYIQEAGRAGRDRELAACVLLYDPSDVETQFGLSSLSELTRRDIAEILRGLRRIKNRRDDTVVATSGELLRDQYRVKLQRGWPKLIETAELRQAVAGIVLKTLLAKLPPDAPAARDLLVSFGTDELAAALAADTSMGGRIKDPLAAIDRALMFLHEHQAIILHQGLAVFRSAMIITLPPEAKRKQYSKAQHRPLIQHYSERTFQIHVMDEYARLGAAKISEALALVMDYFEKGKSAFVRRWFSDRREMLKRATTAESFRRIVESLGNPVQLEIVAADEDGNRLVLAGPGSGKTRVIVHRCAYLLRVKRVPARSILVLCFNRSAALELRRRLAGLVGDDARGVTVQTYHGFAMRLTGHSFAERIASADDETPSFDGLITEAVDLLEGRVELPGIDGDQLRDRLLTGFRHILVDEYQDIDADQYRLVSAIAGRTRVDEDEKLTLLAVGDDDQNIYAFRHTSVEFIRRFERDYDAKLYYLVENYRSSAHIIDAANALISRNTERMKTGQPVRIDRRRRDAPPGGRWQDLDPVGRGRVMVQEVEDAARQAAALAERVRELKRIGGHQWSGFAVLARGHRVLEPIRAMFEHEGVPLAWHGDVPPLHRVREIDAFLGALKEQGHQSLSVDDLNALLPVEQTVWRGLVVGLIEDWRAEAGESPVSAARIAEFCYEILAEQRRDQVVGDGVLLSTLHGAKGLEFPHVLIADGGWNRKRQAADEERRVFYVG